MEIVRTGERWDGVAAAEQFCRTFIPSNEGMSWIPQSHVIGPQGVLDVVNMTASSGGRSLHSPWWTSKFTCSR